MAAKAEIAYRQNQHKLEQAVIKAVVNEDKEILLKEGQKLVEKGFPVSKGHRRNSIKTAGTGRDNKTETTQGKGQGRAQEAPGYAEEGAAGNFDGNAQRNT